MFIAEIFYSTWNTAEYDNDIKFYLIGGSDDPFIKFYQFRINKDLDKFIYSFNPDITPSYWKNMTINYDTCLLGSVIYSDKNSISENLYPNLTCFEALIADISHKSFDYNLLDNVQVWWNIEHRMCRAELTEPVRNFISGTDFYIILDKFILSKYNSRTFQIK